MIDGPRFVKVDGIVFIEYEAFINLRKELKHCRLKNSYNKKEARKLSRKKNWLYYKCVYCNKFHLSSQKPSQLN